MSRTYRKMTPGYNNTCLDKDRDGKKWYKPSSWFKRIKRKKRRAQDRDALRKEKEVMPIHKKEDVWEWN